jgi:hypothetical protein
MDKQGMNKEFTNQWICFAFVETRLGRCYEFIVYVYMEEAMNWPDFLEVFEAVIAGTILPLAASGRESFSRVAPVLMNRCLSVARCAAYGDGNSGYLKWEPYPFQITDAIPRVVPRIFYTTATMRGRNSDTRVTRGGHFNIASSTCRRVVAVVSSTCRRNVAVTSPQISRRQK